MNPSQKIQHPSGKECAKLLSKHKSVLHTGLKQKLTPYHRKTPHLYGLPKIHKLDIPLRPIVSSISSPFYALAGFLQQILNPLTSNTDSFIKNSEHFIHSLKCIEMGGQDIMVSFDVVSLFTNVTVNEVLQVTKNLFIGNQTLTQCSPLQVNNIKKLSEICLKTTYFQVEDNSSSRRMAW
jgi:hypothetical protein